MIYGLVNATYCITQKCSRFQVDIYLTYNKMDYGMVLGRRGWRQKCHCQKSKCQYGVKKTILNRFFPLYCYLILSINFYLCTAWIPLQLVCNLFVRCILYTCTYMIVVHQSWSRNYCSILFSTALCTWWLQFKKASTASSGTSRTPKALCSLKPEHSLVSATLCLFYKLCGTDFQCHNTHTYINIGLFLGWLRYWHLLLLAGS